MQPHVRHAKLLVCPVCGQYEDPLGDRGREIQRDRIQDPKGMGYNWTRGQQTPKNEETQAEAGWWEVLKPQRPGRQIMKPRDQISRARCSYHSPGFQHADAAMDDDCWGDPETYMSPMGR